MEELIDLIKEQGGYIDYETIHHNQAIKDNLYVPIQINQEETPFDYIQMISLEENEEIIASIFIEPVGCITFIAPTIQSFFDGVNLLFNSQPKDMGYALAGHTLAAYAREIRKGMGIDFRYLDTDILWNIDINKEEKEEVTFQNIRTGRDLFHHIKQKNRVKIVITDDILFYTSGITDLMLGEILHVEEQMPDFFKLVIDLSKFEQHNKEIVNLSGYSETFKECYPKNHIIEHYLSFDTVIDGEVGFKLIHGDEVTHYKNEGKDFWQLDFDGSYQDYKQQTKG